MNFWIIIITCVIFQTAKLISCNSVSKLQSPFERVFSRKRRFIVFSNYAAMKITVAMGKSLIAKYPRGVNLSLELSVYYPLPTELEEWYPKKYRSSTTTKKPIGMRIQKPMPENMQMMNQMSPFHGFKYYPVHSEGGTVWIDSAGWNPNFNSTFVGKPDKIKNRIWNNENDYYKKYFPENYYKRYHYPRNWTTDNHNTWMNWTPKKDFSHWNIPTASSLYQSSQKLHKSFQPHQSQTIKYQQKIFDKISDPERFNKWKDFRGARDRRDLFHHLEVFGNILGVNFKSCILRAICESRRYLLPKGYSLIQDILRIIFTFPTVDGDFDEFSRQLEQHENDCSGFFRRTCPLSILDMVMNPDAVKYV